MQFKIKNARLSFPNLFQTSTYNDEDTGKYDCTLILDKTEHAAIIKEMLDACVLLCKEELKMKGLPPDRYFIKDGDQTERPELQGKYYVRASSRKRPVVVDRDKSALTEENEVIYAGCYVNAVISTWVQSNKFGNRINANINGVQFWRNGEPFGTAGIDVEEFDAFGDPPEDNDDVPF